MNLEPEELKPKTSSTTLLEESNGVGQQPEPEPSLSKMGLPDFRFAFYQATGSQLPGSLNNQAVEYCQHNPRDKLLEWFSRMAEQGGKTFKYFREIADGKPKAVVERKSKSEQRQDAAVLAAQETMKRVRELKDGQRRQADRGFAGTDGCTGK